MLSRRPRQTSSRYMLTAICAVTFASLATAQWDKTASSDLHLRAGPGLETQPEIATADDGSIFVAWQHRDDSTFPAGELDLFLQRLTPSGKGMWPGDGFRVADTDTYVSIEHSLDVDESGAAWIVYRKESSMQSELRLVCIEADATPRFGPDGIQVTVGGGLFLGPPKLVTLANGGAMIAWQHDADLRIATLNDNGGLVAAPQVIQPNGFEVRLIDMVPSSDGAALVLYKDENVATQDADVFVERYAPAGGPEWSGTFLGVVQPFEVPTITPDLNGGAWIVVNNNNVTAVEFGGGFAFQPAFVEPSTNSLVEQSTKICVEPSSGDAIVFFHDSNQVGYGRLGAQRISTSGLRLWGPTGITAGPWGPGTVYSLDATMQDGVARAVYRSRLSGVDSILSTAIDPTDMQPQAVVTLSSGFTLRTEVTSTLGELGDVIAVWTDGATGDLGLQNVSSAGELGPVAGAVARRVPGNFDGYFADVGSLGGTVSMAIDLSLTGQPLGLVVGFPRPGSIPFAGQTILVDLGGVELLRLAPQPGTVASFTAAIPNDASLCGTRVVTQGVSLGGGQPLQFTNSQDLYLGL